MYEYAATLVKLVDGDTLHADIDVGFSITVAQIIRFYGVNAPEMETQAGKDAKAWVAEWFATHCPTNGFTLNTIKDRREKYGRFLGIITAADKANLNQDLVAAGHAVPYFPKGVQPQ
jgi:endonuclease YncB( thermonuclease family)